MNITIDSAGRLYIPKSLREKTGLKPGASVEVSEYGAGLQIIPSRKTAKLVKSSSGRLVAESDEKLDDDVLFAIIDSGRK